MSLILKSICLIYFLLQDLHIIVTAKRVRNSADTNIILKVPPCKKKIPANGIVRVIEYIIPKSTNKHKHKPEKKKKRNIIKSILKKPSTRTLINLRHAPNSTNPTNFLMKVRENNTIICTGSLITTSLVLSSTSCFPNNPLPSHYQLEDSSNQEHLVDQLFLGTSLGFELAIMRLPEDIEDPLIQPVPLCNRQLSYQDSVNMYMTKLRVNFLRTQIVENAICKQSYLQNEFAYITENMICVQNSNVAKDCELTTKGDPLLREGQLCGVNIYGPNCVEGAINGDLYVNIFRALDFIEQAQAKFK
ncbi:uncharacterized protein LOC117791048 [Drosophila innubila]|uniref:uncharacterized protein LOC117791048 n=1 Tax=Drosophila innubila TaxID=198719 RepID=UPI00148BC1C9|nr:uncharacterized protein LOC117791048 [Drosophila innubila]